MNKKTQTHMSEIDLKRVLSYCRMRVEIITRYGDENDNSEFSQFMIEMNKLMDKYYAGINNHRETDSWSQQSAECAILQPENNITFSSVNKDNKKHKPDNNDDVLITDQ